MSNKNNILILDDDPVLITFLEKYFSNEGYLIHTANTVSEGVRKVLDHSPDLIVCDINIGFLNGRDFLELMKNIKYCDRIIFITGEQKERTEKFLLNCKIDKEDLIFKPLDLPALKSRIAVKLRNLGPT